MKKIFTLVSLLLSAGNFAQTIDFESHPLTLESYDNGSGGGGDFTFGPLTLSNYYDVGWGSWNGFSVSNVTDNTTAGYGNQYSAFPGMGSNGSSNYAIYYPDGAIIAADDHVINGFYITNDTYTAISMRDGDAFAKQFGSIYGADGLVDGTNGEDYFRVWIIGEDANGNKDSVLHYLADYRYANPLDDYIVEGWGYINLAVLSIEVKQLNFAFESSDMGAWGINTPVYFAIDDISYSDVLSINEISSELFEMYPNPAENEVNILGNSGGLKIHSLSGELMYENQLTGQTIIDLSDFNYGIYFVSVSNERETTTQKLIVR